MIMVGMEMVTVMDLKMIQHITGGYVITGTVNTMVISDVAVAGSREAVPLPCMIEGLLIGVITADWLKRALQKKCRDANEDHGKGFDDIGCDKKRFGNQLGKPIPEDDGICWEVSRFGYTTKKDGTKMPSVVGGSPAPSSEGGDSGSGDECVQKKKTKFFLKVNKKGKVIKKTCKWLKKKSKKIKKRICASDDSNDEFPPATIACPITCDTCDDRLSSI